MKIKYLLIFTAIIALLSGCSSNKVETKVNNQAVVNNISVDTENSNEIKRKTFEGISFEYLDSFQEFRSTTVSDETKYVAYVIDNGSTSINLVVEDIPTEMTLDDYVKLSVENAGINVIKSGNFKLNDLDLNQTLSSSSQNNVELISNQVTLVYNGKAYVFTYASISENYDRYMPTFTNVINSIQIESPLSSQSPKEQPTTESNDPVYDQMMNPNTELGKTWNEISGEQKEIDENSKKREDINKKNDEETMIKRKEIETEINKLENEKLKYPNDEKKLTEIQGNINILQNKLDTWYSIK